jgi:hypothetical protein
MFIVKKMKFAVSKWLNLDHYSMVNDVEEPDAIKHDR